MKTIGVDARLAKNVNTGIGKDINNWLLQLINLDKENKYIIFAENYADWASPELIKSLSSTKNFTKVIIPSIHLNIPTQIKFAISDQILLLNTLKKNPCDIFFTPYFNIPFFINHKNLICTIHDLDIYKNKSYSFYKRFYYNLLLKRCIELSKIIFTISLTSKNEIINTFNLPGDKITIINPGISTIFKPISKDLARNYIEKKYNIYRRFFLYSGGFSLRKNLSNIFNAFDQITKIYPGEYELVLTGNKENINFSHYPISINNENIRFIGQVDENEMPYFYSAAELTLYPSLREGFGIPIIESQACGTPVLTSCVSSMPEVSGEAAILVNPLSVEQIVSGIRKIIDDVSIKSILIESGLANSKKYAWINGVKEILKIFYQIDNSKRA